MRITEESDSARHIADLEADAHALEEAFAILQSPERTLAHPDRLLAILRERLDADYCWLVQEVGTELGGRIAPGAVVGRAGWTNKFEWLSNLKLARKIDSFFIPGEILELPVETVVEVRGMFANEEAKTALKDLTSHHVVHLRVFGEFHGVIGIGFNIWRALEDRERNFIRRLAQVVESTLERAESHQRLDHIRQVAQFRSDVVEYMFHHTNYAEVESYIGDRILAVTRAQHVVLYQNGGNRIDRCSAGMEKVCRDCAVNRPERIPTDISAKVNELIVTDASKGYLIDRPEHCPARSSVLRQTRRANGRWWRVVADFTASQAHDLPAVSRTLQVALDLLVMAYEREENQKTIARQMEQTMEMSAQLITERDRVVEAEKAKAAFFSSVSHDIRTPLTAIIGFSELLEMGGVSSEEASQAVHMIGESGKSLLHLVNDLMDLSKLEAGKLAIQPEPTDVEELLKETRQMFMAMAAKAGQTLSVEVAEFPILMLDAYRVRQIIFNLVGNAVKYAGISTIRVSAAYEPHGGRGATALPSAGLVGAALRADRGVFTLTVADDGTGISPEDAKRLMTPYSQVSASDRKKGTGLGLFICRQLAERMGGTFTLDSALGKGCRFTLAVPAQEVEELNVEDSDNHQLPTTNHHLRVLVVDDSAVNRTVLTGLLRNLEGMSYEVAENGKLALSLLKKDAAFDWVLTDMWMPEMSGGELLKAIRADAKLSSLKVCAVTADVAARDTYQEQGFDALLLKPVTSEILRNLLASATKTMPPN